MMRKRSGSRSHSHLDKVFESLLSQLRLRPYKNGENRIDGAVIALFDLDAAAQ